MFCTRCGVQLEERDRFCSDCGTPTGRGPAPVLQRPLLRSVTNKRIAGVCGGLAAYMNADPTLIRLLWILFILALLPVGILGYIIAWIIIPKEQPVIYAYSSTPMQATPQG
ncbi:MAG TPA: PspC domain-containing protein [Bryobacteraceae bacterium]|nr:PspC domain-containing protein [Bryobacteraceae bacterium]